MGKKSQPLLLVAVGGCAGDGHTKRRQLVEVRQKAAAGGEGRRDAEEKRERRRRERRSDGLVHEH